MSTNNWNVKARRYVHPKASQRTRRANLAGRGGTAGGRRAPPHPAREPSGHVLAARPTEAAGAATSPRRASRPRAPGRRLGALARPDAAGFLLAVGPVFRTR